ncbi:hypothetical protein QUC31_018044, partial [Theobroma cacao]
SSSTGIVFTSRAKEARGIECPTITGNCANAGMLRCNLWSFGMTTGCDMDLSSLEKSHSHSRSLLVENAGWVLKIKPRSCYLLIW